MSARPQVGIGKRPLIARRSRSEVSHATPIGKHGLGDRNVLAADDPEQTSTVWHHPGSEEDIGKIRAPGGERASVVFDQLSGDQGNPAVH